MYNETVQRSRVSESLPAKALATNEPNEKGEERILRTKNAIGIPVGMGQNLIGVSFL